MANNTGKKYGGRKKGTPNKSTDLAREAVAKFVDDNAERLQTWLDRIADGVTHPTTKETLVKPDPEAAFKAFMSVVEYHIPKLARVDGQSTSENKIIIEHAVRTLPNSSKKENSNGEESNR